MTTESSRRHWTAADVLEVHRLTDARISPDGSRVAYTVGVSYKEKAAIPKSCIWAVDTMGGEPRQLTTGSRADIAPRWSPDSQTLAFLSDREEDGRFLLYTLGMGGGEAQKLGALKGNIANHQWSPDGRRIAFLMEDPETDQESELEARENHAREYETRPRFQRLWVMDLASGDARAVSIGDVQVWEFAWFPDGESFAIVCSDEPYEWSWYRSWLGRVPVSGGDVTLIHRSDVQLAHPLPAEDGQHVAFVGGVWSDRGVLGGGIYLVPTGGGEGRDLTEGYPASFSWMEWLDVDRLIAIGYEDGKAALFQVSTTGAPQRLWSAEAAFADRWWARASVTGDGSALAVIMEDRDNPPDVWTVEVSDDGVGTRDERRGTGDEGREGIKFTRRTWMHPQLDVLERVESETVRWVSPDGTQVQGLLYLPAGEPRQGPYPLVTMVHGGPTSLFTHSHVSGYYWAPLLLAKGYSLFMPNPRGSTGWGRAFSEANLGDMGGGDLVDILSGVDALVERGVADADRLGISGWSYGGYMTAWAVTQTDRFRVAMMGAGISNWVSFHGVSTIPAWDRLFWQADPYDPEGPFVRYSPVYHAGKVRTPMLILHGEADTIVPVGQAYEWFRALREHEVEAKLVTYPGEGHAIREKAHMEDMLGRIVEWFDGRLAASR